MPHVQERTARIDIYPVGEHYIKNALRGITMYIRELIK